MTPNKNMDDVKENSTARILHWVFSMLALPYFSASALAGPPLSIDDPGILSPGEMEFITATTVTSTDAGDFYQLPLLDVSVGVIQDRMQVAVVYPYVHAVSDDARSEWGFGNLEISAKWRFMNNDKLQMAIAPTYALGVSGAVAEKNIGDNADVFYFPMNVEFQVNPAWRFNAEVRYASIEGGNNEWAYGAAVSRALKSSWEILLELAATANSHFDTDFVEARAGFDVALTESVHLLFSVATGLHEPRGAEELDYDVFLGIQYLR